MQKYYGSRVYARIDGEVVPTDIDSFTPLYLASDVETAFPWSIEKDMTYVPTAEFKRKLDRIADLERTLRWMKEKQVIWHPTMGLIEEKYASDYEKADAPEDVEALVRSL